MDLLEPSGVGLLMLPEMSKSNNACHLATLQCSVVQLPRFSPQIRRSRMAVRGSFKLACRKAGEEKVEDTRARKIQETTSTGLIRNTDPHPLSPSAAIHQPQSHDTQAPIP